MQGVSFSMVAYDIGVLPLIKQMKALYPDIPQSWYADDAGALSMYNNIELYFNLIKHFFVVRGYSLLALRLVL